MNNILKVRNKYNIKILIFSILLPLSIGSLSAFLGMSGANEYVELINPKWAPPSFVFAPVWTVLYILMGIASYRVLMYDIRWSKNRLAIILYYIQLLLNFLWSILFFRLELRGIAFIEILLLLFFIVLTYIKFYKIDKISAKLLIPYILWVSFAAVLNYSIWVLNT